MQNPYSEDQLIEQPAIALLADLGWETLDCFDEFSQVGGSPIGRETKSEVVLTSRLHPALRRLNPDASEVAVDAAIEEITRTRSAMSPPAANHEIYTLLKDGVRVTAIDPDGEEEPVEILRVIDWSAPANNDFLAASQIWISGEMYLKRPDLIGFINGLPLLSMEFKRIDEPLYSAYNDNLRDYKDTIPHLFWYNALIILSNGSESRFGGVTASWEHFAEWKRVSREEEQGASSLETMLRGICNHERLLDLIENFTLFMEAQGGLIKLIAKNHQYLGANNAIRALQEIDSNRGKLGVFWHTQGSGKSVSMIFFAQKVLRKIPGNWSFVLVTDRVELDNQLYKNFASCRGVVIENEVHAENVAHLRQLLSQDHRYIFTLIQKFQTRDGESHPVLSKRSDIIVITDESHRSQYDTLALNMRTALPNAAFIAFTGTPLIAGEERTRQVFGDYVSVYDFKQSVEDGATVPLFYENRVPSLQLTNEDLNEEMEGILEAAELDDAQEAKLEREFAREYHLITREDRLDAIAKDIVSHFMGRGHRGKAMVISIDKAATVKMYDKVQARWKEYLEGLRSELDDAASPDQGDPLEAKIRYMDETDMAVVVSKSRNEIDDLRRREADIVPHRRRMNAEDLDTKFKDPEDPFRIVFVCSMWSTGFDVPSCSTIYLDKPQRNHTLMQTIARANRVFRDKVNGLIVDYIGVFRDLEKALATYAGRDDTNGGNPIEDKSKLVEILREAIVEINAFCMGIGVDLFAINNAEVFARSELIDDAVNKILINDATKREYLQLAENLTKLYKAILPDSGAQEFVSTCSLADIIRKKIRKLIASTDISDVMGEVESLLDQSVAPEGYVIEEEEREWEAGRLIDLSEIDFEALRERFRTKHKGIEAEKLRAAINRKLTQLVHVNRTRMDFQEKFEEMIAEYNDGRIKVELHFEELIGLAGELTEEERRADGERLTEEELTVFDYLARSEEGLADEERDKVKEVSRTLLDMLKREKLVLDWRKRQQSRAAVKLTIQKILDDLPERYSPELYEKKCDAVYQHIYDSYFGDGKSVYTITHDESQQIGRRDLPIPTSVLVGVPLFL